MLLVAMDRHHTSFRSPSWTIAHRPSHVVDRIVGEEWAPRSHELRDLLTRNSIPFEFYAADSEAGQLFIKDFAIDVRRLPFAIHHDGSDQLTTHWIARAPGRDAANPAVVAAGLDTTGRISGRARPAWQSRRRWQGRRGSSRGARSGLDCWS